MATDLGRPVRTVDSIDRNAVVERLLVEGELVVDTDGRQARVYPTSTEVAERANVSKSWVSKYAKANRCFERRALMQAQIKARAQEQLIRQESKRLAYDTERTLQLCDKVLERYESLVTEKGINNFTAGDLNTIVRLRRYLEGDADSRQEVMNTITLDTLQSMHRDMLRQVHSATDAECGIEAEEVEVKALASPFDEGNSGSES